MAGELVAGYFFRGEVDAEGWFAQGDSEGPLTWVADGGNPAPMSRSTT